MTAACPICTTEVAIPDGTEVTEIISCLDCGSRLVVTAINDSSVTVEPAPEVEEDWGE